MRPSQWAAGVLAYVAAVTLLGKFARIIELSLRLDSMRPWMILPAVLGQDLLLIGSVGLLAHALGRLRSPWGRWPLTLLLLLPIAVLAPADVVSHVLTGTPLTLSRLRGDEGGTLSHLYLIDTFELATGLLGIALGLFALWPSLRYAGRVPLLLRWARPRALLVTLLLGCASSVAQMALLPRTSGLAGTPVFVLLDSMVERPHLSGVALSDQQWAALQQPSRPTPHASLPRREGPPPKNVVIFLAEGIPYKHTGFDPRFVRDGLPDPTPNLTRLHAQHGLLFDRYYANWHASIQAIFSVVCSKFPPLSGDIVRIKPRIDCGEFSEVMKARGRTSGLFHGGEFSFYNKLALLGRRAYAIERDAPDLAKDSRRSRNQWGIDDRAMADATLAWVDSLPRAKPFAALLIPITAHYPYWTPRDWKRRVKGSSRQKRFLNAVAFQDAVFADLVRGFQQRGLYDDTLFVWLGDHGHYVDEPERLTPGLRGFYEPNLHIPLLLINRRMFPDSLPSSARRTSRLGSHVDLLPTILDALSEPPDARHEGQSLLAGDFSERRMFFGAEDGKYVGFTEGHHKFVLNTHNSRTEYYDLASDPDELKDLSDHFAERMLRNSETAFDFARGVTYRIESAKVLREKVSIDAVYELFMKHAAVRVKHGALAECEANRDPGCPRVDELLRVKTARVQGTKQRCVMVSLPEDGEVTLRITHRDTLTLLTGTIAGLLLNKQQPSSTVRVETIADGVQQPSVFLKDRGAERLGHPRAERELRIVLSEIGKPGAASTVCLQLTTGVLR